MPTTQPTPGLTLLDWIVIAAYVLLLLAVGWYYSRKTASTDDYLLGGRQMKWFSLGISLFATMLSAVTYLAMPGEMIRYGPVFALGKVAAYPLVALIVGWWIIPRIMELKVTSAYEILELRLGLSVRLLGSLFFLSLRLMWMALIVHATSSMVLVPLLGLDESATPWICVVLGAVTVAYTSLGGLRAVVMTDVLQSVILFGGALLTLGLITYHFGGVSGWWPDAWPEHWPEPRWGYDPNPKTRPFVGALIGTLVWYVCTQGSDQMVVQRFLANRDVKAARRTLFTALISSALTGGLLTLVGLAVWSYYRSIAASPIEATALLDRADKLFPEFIMSGLPSGVSGLVVAGLLAVAMSSLSSGVNSSCSVIKIDFIDRLRRSSAGSQRHNVVEAMWISVGVGVVVVLLSSCVGLVQGNLLALAFKVCNLLTAPLFGLFFMAMFVRGATVPGTHAGAACGLAVVVAVNYWEEITGTPGINFLWAMPLGLAAQIAVGVVVSWCFPRGPLAKSQLPNVLLKVAIQMSTSPRTTSKCSPIPRPWSPSVPIEWASSIINRSLMPLFDFDELGQVGNVAVHAVNAFDHQQHAAIFVAELAQKSIRHLPIVMRERPTPSARQNAPLQNTVVRQGVVEDQVAGSHQVSDHGLVGGVSADEAQCGLGSQELGDLPLEFDVEILFARDEPTGRDAGAVFSRGVLSRLDDDRVARHADIVVTREVDHLAAVDGRAVVGEALVDREERIAKPQGVGHVQALPQLDVFRELGDAIVVRRDLGVGGPSFFGTGLRAEIGLDGLDHVAAGLQVRQDLFGKASAKTLFERGEDLHPFERIHPHFGNRRIERQPNRAFLGDFADLLQDQRGHPLGARLWRRLAAIFRSGCVHVARDGRFLVSADEPPWAPRFSPRPSAPLFWGRPPRPLHPGRVATDR